MAEVALSDRCWLLSQVDALTVTHEVLRPSDWAEKKRYLPPSATAAPGYYRFSVTPYLKEILDCMSVDSPVREVSVMKGAQIGVTVGVLENTIGYLIDHVRTAPTMMVTADADLAKSRVDSYIIPMLQHSGLEELLKSADEGNNRKTGKTAKKLEWYGGGFLLPYGSLNAAKLRSYSIQYLLNDEVDGWPQDVGNEGHPLDLAIKRTAGFDGSRKVLNVSTPLIKGASKIEDKFSDGDQRHYFVCCLNCNHPQTLRWQRVNPETGEKTGIIWETQNGILVPESVRYLCEKCAHPHTNDDKTRLLSPDNGAEWKAQSTPKNPYHRSYHIPSLLSPVGMMPWASAVEQWLDAWDEDNSRPKDNGKLQVFYNTVLGNTFEIRGDRVRFEQVSPHRRQFYRFGEVPNKVAIEACGSPILVVTCAVDVHKDNLAVATFGWCRGQRVWLIDYWRFEGDTEQLDNPETWGRLRKLIEEHEYVADDGKRYGIKLTLIDSGYRTDTVYTFASEYEAGVVPVKGREFPPKNATVRHFSEFTTPMGTRAFGVTVDLYKEGLAAALKREWDGIGMQPPGHFNAPADVTDKQLRELTREVKREKIDKTSNRRDGWEWHRTGGSDNELWDCLVYGSASLDMIARDVCVVGMGLEMVNWLTFYDWCLSPPDPRKPQQKPFFTDGVH